MADITVLQVDREAAASMYLTALQGRATKARNIRAGHYDSQPIVQAFARHRLAHTPADHLRGLSGEARDSTKMVELLVKQHEAMADVMTLRRLSSTPQQREMAEKAIAVWREVDEAIASLGDAASPAPANPSEGEKL